MGLDRIATQRLHNQRIMHPGPAQPAEIVSWLGAVQAQEYAAAKWAVGLRMANGATNTKIERAFNDGRILRTHVMRPTWHFVAAADIHWLLELTAPRVQRAMSYGYRQLELESDLRTKATTLFENGLSREPYLTRVELGACLARAGIAAKGVRLALLTIHAELERVICSGPKRGTQQTYALLANRVPRGKRLAHDEALAELTNRYFRSHAPATIRDFVWWSGLATKEAKRGLDIIGALHKVIDGHTYWMLDRGPISRRRGALVHLLPVYDEYLVAYRDRHAVPRQSALFGVLPQALVAAGQVVGTWKTVRTAGGQLVDVAPHRPLNDRERRALNEAVERYGDFLEASVSINCDGESGK